MQITLILALVFSLLIATFAIQNTALVTVRFLFWGGPVSLVQLILGCVAIGAIIMFLLGTLKSFGFFWKRRELLSTNEKLNKTIDELKKKLAELEEEKAKHDQANQEINEPILVNKEQPEP